MNVDETVLENMKAQATQEEEALAEANEIDEVFASCFNTPAGERVISILREWTIEQPCCPPGAPEGTGYFREGENRIVRAIQAHVKRAGEH